MIDKLISQTIKAKLIKQQEKRVLWLMS